MRATNERGKMKIEKEQLQKNILTLQETIQNLAKEDQDVRVVAVSKYVDVETIKMIYDLGIRDFGENRSQELLAKQAELSDEYSDIKWHFIGRLQRRPVKKMINYIDYLHSLDRMSLVKEVDKRADKVISSFLQVNISGEENKAGFSLSEVEAVIEEIAFYPNIKIIGLMTMAPYEADKQELQQIFSALKDKQLLVQAENYEHAPCSHLSMGMSRDYPIAIQAGADFLRIGRALYEEN